MVCPHRSYNPTADGEKGGEVSESFVFYRSFAKSLEKLPAEQYKKIMMAVCQYALDGDTPTMDDPVVEAIFLLIQPQIDANTRKRESGKKGADSRWSDGKPMANDSKGMANDSKAMANDSKDMATPCEPIANVNANVNANANANANENVNANENANALLTPLREKKRVADKKEKPSKKKSVYDPDEKLNQAILDFIEFRRSAKKPMTDNAIDLMLKKLRGMASDNDERIAILEQSVLNGWTGLYPLKAEKARGEPEDRFKVISDWLTGMEGNDDISGIC